MHSKKHFKKNVRSFLKFSTSAIAPTFAPALKFLKNNISFFRKKRKKRRKRHLQSNRSGNLSILLKRIQVYP